MRDYFIRRLLLVPLTLIGITLIIFTLTRFAPGGPLEVALMQAAMGGSGESARATREQRGSLSPEQLQRLEEDFKYDRPIPIAYLQWLGVLPTETNRVRGDLVTVEPETVPGDSSAEQIVARAEINLPASLEPTIVHQTSSGSLEFDPDSDPARIEGWSMRLETAENQRQRYLDRMRLEEPPADISFQDQVIVHEPRHLGLLQGYLGRSLFYNIPVWDMMKQRIPISVFFGLSSMLIVYIICIPLGIIKAIRHRTLLDTTSSIIIFAGYAVPGFVLGVFLLSLFAVNLKWFPIEGFVSAEFATRNLGGKILDLLHHAALPLVCYVVSGFAMLTMLVKNNLMDNLAADYVRTAVAKGVEHKRAIFGHALRNSMIPVATTLGEIITIFVAGNLLVERVFNIDGFGLLAFNALLQRDQTVVLGFLTVAALLMLIGNILSDVIVASIDPRIRFK